MNNFETNTRDMLRSSESAIDSQVAKQLSDARAQAVLNPDPKPWFASFMLPVTGMALASIMALVIVFSPSLDNNSSDDELLLSEGIELYEDLDFYQWLASNESQLRG